MNQVDRYIDSSSFCILVFIAILSTLTTLISVGFGALNQNLNISGDIDYEEDNNYLYNVLKNEARTGTYAKEYTGEHQDSMNVSLSTEKIYYWKATSNANANTILDKWNVIFGGFCWQMIRTTDTGGVKLVYNGLPTNGQCNNEGTDQEIGKSTFNAVANSLAYQGYMYNTVYPYSTKSVNFTQFVSKIEMTNSANYYYGTDVTYSGGIYTLTGTTQDTWVNSYSSASGLYTCKSETSTTCSSVYYIAEGTSWYMYGFKMTSGNLLNYYNTNITLGTGWSESNGEYTLTGTTTITKADWVSDYSTYVNYYTCGNDQTTCTNMKYIKATINYAYYSLSSSNNWIYANDFTYNSGTDTYTLGSDRYQSWDMANSYLTNLATHHYTCFNDTGECNTLSYVYFAIIPSTVSYIFYINLTDGKGVEDAINEMLYDDNVNTTNSTIKTYIDNWYQNNLSSYTSYLEDTIFCNDRSQNNQLTNGWNPNGGNVGTYMSFKNHSTNGDLSCTNDTDKFSLSNSKARLTYPVGLLTSPEAYLLNNNNLRKTGQVYAVISPYYFYRTTATMCSVNGEGQNSYIVSTPGVRPVVSLKPETEYASGTGSKDDPYIIDTT